ncbi:MerR family transcriptional regulator [Nocardioides ferulae]|uniref:MerR family transcriptional regulator n=1 Tax=Nocardioides ferulae TaxID=2340821 RepID=UPI000EB35868|nr:MerR family transcriptional regulator [Nocardioides ferulae]
MDLMGIGDFARATGLTPKALRLYDELGLLCPADVDTATGYRRYAPEQLEAARLVARLRLVGMPLARIRRVVALGPGEAAIEVAAFWRQVEADTVSRRALVTALLRDLEPEDQAMAPPPTSPTALDAPQSASRIGQGARESQQDAVLEAPWLFAVADGFGATPGLADAALAAAREALDAPTVSMGPATALAAAVTAAEAALGGRSDSPHDGTTVTLLWLTEGRAWVAHVGDGRVLRLRDTGLDRLTRDHTLVAALVEEGRLTEDEARVHPHRALLNRALAPGGSAEPDLASYDARPGDRFVLTTDGVHAVLEPDALTRLLTAGTVEEAVDRVSAAVEAAGAPDNHAVVVVDVPSAP